MTTPSPFVESSVERQLAPAALPLSVQHAARWYGTLAASGWSAFIAGVGLSLAAGATYLFGQPSLASALALPAAGALVAAAALLPAAILTSARQRMAEAADAALVARQQRHAAAAARVDDAPAAQALFAGGDDPDVLVQAESARVLRLAGWPQAAIALPLASLAGIMAWLSWPNTSAVPGGFGLGFAWLLISFPVLVLERRLTLVGSSGTTADLPEAAGLSRILRLFMWTLVVVGASEIARSLGANVAIWALWAQTVVVIAVAAELALRVAAAPFLPAASINEARGLADSALAGLILPRLGAGKGGATELKERFGIDLSQSWALRFVRRVSIPLVAILLVIGWLLSGITTLSLQERGVYERFGAPVAVLKSGLHVHLPYPFGIVRRVEFGQVYELAIGVNKGAVGVTTNRRDTMVDDVKTADQAEALPLKRLAADILDTSSFDRIWRREHVADAVYIVPSDGGDAISRAAHVLNSDVRVFYRIGLDDQAARAALYGVVSPEENVLLAARRQLARVFATRSLMQAIGEDREQLGAGVRRALQQELTASGSGLEVMAVTIDSIHPPKEAAAAYHGVQEASIIAARGVSEARGNAATVMSEKEIEATVGRNNAVWTAANLVAKAKVETTLFNADAQAWRSASKVLALERWLQVMGNGMSNSQLDIIDHRLRLLDGPVLDMRNFNALRDSEP
jgi:regulator of protease activity HflC (stomatin/prohibitin superfamily)